MNARDAALEEAAKVLDRRMLAEPSGECEEHVNEVIALLAWDIRALKS